MYHFSRTELSATVDYCHTLLGPSQLIPLWLPSLSFSKSPPAFCRFVADCWFMVLSQTPTCNDGFNHAFTFRMAIINICSNIHTLFFGLRRRCSTRRPPSISKTTSASPLPFLPPPNTTLYYLSSTCPPPS